MKKRNRRKVVFFVYSKEEAIFAAKYAKSHPTESIKIFASSIASILTLKDDTAMTSQLQNLSKLDKRYSKGHLELLQKQTQEIYHRLKDKFKPFLVENINLIEVIKILLQEEVYIVLQAYSLFQAIKKVYNPKKYYFSSELTTKKVGWDPSYFAVAALMKDFFCDKSKVKVFFTTNRSNYLFQKNTSIKEIYKKIRTIGELLFLRARDRARSNSRINSAILMFSGGYNLYYYHRLIEQLNKIKDPSMQILTGSQSIEDELLLRKNSVKFLSLEKLNNLKLRGEIDYQLKTLKSYINSEMIEENFRKALPKNTPQEVLDAIYFKFNLILKSYAHKSIKQIVLANSALEIFTPKLMVTTHDPGPSALPFVLGAKVNNIPSLLLLHGFHTMSFLADHQSDYLASWGPVLKAGFVNKLHKNPRSIFSVGFPFLDTYFRKDGPYQKKYISKIKSSFTKMRLGVLLTIHPGDHLARPKFLFDLFKAINSSALPIEVQIRAHAGQNVNSVQDLAKHFGVDCICNEKIGLDQFIQQNDVILSWDTTAILWAMIYHKPVLYTTPWWKQGAFPVAQYEAGWLITSPKSMTNELRRLYANPNRTKLLIKGQDKFLRDVLGVLDGTSSEKLLNLLRELSRQGSVRTRNYK